MSPHSRTHSAKRMLDRLIKDAAARSGHWREPFWQLIRAIRARSQLLAPRPPSNQFDLQVSGLIRACHLLSEHHSLWQRDPEAWTTDTGSSYEQFRSLVSHLFDKYPVPNCMLKAWLSCYPGSWELALYLHLARGLSVRQFKFPAPFHLSKRGATWFMQAPDDLDPVQALRWAQVRSLGGDKRLARILVTRPQLRSLRSSEPFWESLIRFLVRYDPIEEFEVVQIVRFADEQRFPPTGIVFAEREEGAPVQTDFSLEGRSLMSLRRYMTQCRAAMRVPPSEHVWQPAKWARTSINPFQCYKGELCCSIDELLTGHDLHEEAHFMQHCVLSYLRACVRRRTSIWSMKVKRGAHTRRLLTIEVIPHKKLIRQAKGKRNAAPCELAKKVLREWALQEDLKFEKR